MEHFTIIGGGITLGVIAAIFHNKLIDQLIRVFVTIGWSFPTFVFGCCYCWYSMQS